MRCLVFLLVCGIAALLYAVIADSLRHPCIRSEKQRVWVTPAQLYIGFDGNVSLLYGIPISAPPHFEMVEVCLEWK